MEGCPDVLLAKGAVGVIRGCIAVVPEERAISTYRLWRCFDCGLEFSMKTLECPKLCPRCQHAIDDETVALNL